MSVDWDRIGAPDGIRPPDPLGKPVVFKWREPPPPPRWAVEGLLPRSARVVLHADTNVGKSMFVHALIAAVLSDEDEFLGHRIEPGLRVLLIDNENDADTLQERLTGMLAGHVSRDMAQIPWDVLEPAINERLLAYNASTSCASLERALRDFRPGLVIIDSLMSAMSALEVNENTVATEVMAELGRLRREYDCCIVLLHHERKASREAGALGNSQEAMGARQWIGQAEASFGMRRVDRSDTVGDDGDHTQTTRVLLSTGKMRRGLWPGDKALRIVSKYRGHAPLWTVLEEDPNGGVTEENVGDVLEYIAVLRDAGDEVQTQDILTELDWWDGDDSTKRAAARRRDEAGARAFSRGCVERTRRGYYRYVRDWPEPAGGDPVDSRPTF